MMHWTSKHRFLHAHFNGQRILYILYGWEYVRPLLSERKFSAIIYVILTEAYGYINAVYLFLPSCHNSMWLWTICC